MFFEYIDDMPVKIKNARSVHVTPIVPKMAQKQLLVVAILPCWIVLNKHVGFCMCHVPVGKQNVGCQCTILA